MKKKLLATLVATAVLSTGIIGLTACGNPGGEDKGDDKIPDTIVTGAEVTSEDWAKAFENTLAAENYTAKLYVENIFKAQGTDEELGEIDLTVTTTQEGPCYYDKGDSYSKAKVKVVATGVPDDEELQEEYKNQEFDIENYTVKDGDVYYSANYGIGTEEDKWTVSTTSSTMSLMGGVFDSCATEKGGERAELSALYDSFTYADGVYTATLWIYDSENTVSVSIKDGYIVGYSTECLTETEYEGNKESDGMKYVYTFSNYGSTTVTPSDAAKKAVEDYKASLSAPSAVAGTTYLFDTVAFEYDDTVTDETKEQTEKVLKPQMEEGYNGTTIAFDDNHGFTMTPGQGSYSVSGTYTENGNVITITPTSTTGEPQALTLTDNTLTMSGNMGSGVTMKLIFILQNN